jgi:hypothetical protein
LLRRYKNSPHQEAGINIEMLQWMANEAKIKNIPPEGFLGGIIIDEMSIKNKYLGKRMYLDLKS